MKVKCPNCSHEFDKPLTEKIEIKGWKGRSDIVITEIKETYEIIEYRKEKETLEVYEDKNIIPKENVERLWKILKRNCIWSEIYKYGEIVEWIIDDYSLYISIDAFNGGKNRKRAYFPYYYYPLKVLEYKNFIQYLGRGGIVMLNTQGKL